MCAYVCVMVYVCMDEFQVQCLYKQGLIKSGMIVQSLYMCVCDGVCVWSKIICNTCINKALFNQVGFTVIVCVCVCLMVCVCVYGSKSCAISFINKAFLN